MTARTPDEIGRHGRRDWLSDQIRAALDEARAWSPRKRDAMRFERIRSRAGDEARVQAARGHLTPLSAEEMVKRRPPPPWMLLGALQDRIHEDWPLTRRESTRIAAASSVSSIPKPTRRQRIATWFWDLWAHLKREAA